MVGPPAICSRRRARARPQCPCRTATRARTTCSVLPVTDACRWTSRALPTATTASGSRHLSAPSRSSSSSTRRVSAAQQRQHTAESTKTSQRARPSRPCRRTGFARRVRMGSADRWGNKKCPFQERSVAQSDRTGRAVTAAPTLATQLNSVPALLRSTSVARARLFLLDGVVGADDRAVGRHHG